MIEDQREVGSLSRQILGLYPSDYRVALASSLLLYPHRYRPALRPSYPCGSDTGLPCSVPMTDVFRPSLLHRQRCLPMTEENGASVPAVSEAYQHLKAPSFFSMLTRVRICWPYHSPLPLSASMLADLSSPHGSLNSLAAAVTLSEGFSTARYQDA